MLKMKRNFFLLMLICVSSIITSCSNDKESVFVRDELKGVYKGKLDIQLNGSAVGTNIPQKIYVTEEGEDVIKIELKNFSFDGTNLGDIAVSNIDVLSNDANNSFIGSQSITLALGECDVDVVGTIKGEILDIDISVTIASLGDAIVLVDFTGEKMDADQSSEALITAFTFSDPDEIVTVKPIINGTDITFVVSEDATENQIKTLVPTITISELATITPASGVAADFNVPVTYTVLSEDGISKTTYTVSITAKSNSLNYSFDEWVENEDAGYFEVSAEGSLNSTNGGSMFLPTLADDKDSYPDVDFTAVPNVGVVEDGIDSRRGAKLTTLDTRHLLAATKENRHLMPGITPGSVWLGSFNLFAALKDRLLATEFGVDFDKKKPLSFKGHYKYTSGTPFIDASEGSTTGFVGLEGVTEIPGKVDKGSIVAVLFEVEYYGSIPNPDPTDFFNPTIKDVLTGKNINSSEKIVAVAMVGGVDAQNAPNGISNMEEWSSFDIPFFYIPGRAYDPAKKYKITFVCSSSIGGDRFNGGANSILSVDEFEIIYEDLSDQTSEE